MISDATIKRIFSTDLQMKAKRQEQILANWSNSNGYYGFKESQRFKK